jgi:hypothetical protein
MVAAFFFSEEAAVARGVLANVVGNRADRGTRARRVRSFESLQPCFFLQENKMMMTPSAATIAAAVKPAVEISARE